MIFLAIRTYGIGDKGSKVTGWILISGCNAIIYEKLSNLREESLRFPRCLRLPYRPECKRSGKPRFPDAMKDYVPSPEILSRLNPQRFFGVRLNPGIWSLYGFANCRFVISARFSDTLRFVGIFVKSTFEG